VKKECKILIKAPKKKIEDSKQRTKSENLLLRIVRPIPILRVG
jgi:hypothetical protein